MAWSIGEWVVVGLLTTIGGGVAALLKRRFWPRRSKVRVEQVTGDPDHAETNGDWIVFDLEVTAYNDGAKGAKIADVVFESATCYVGDRTTELTPEEIGRGSLKLTDPDGRTPIVALVKPTELQLRHGLAKQMGIHEHVTDSDAIELTYSAAVEDGSIPYHIPITATISVDGLSVPWNQDDR